MNDYFDYFGFAIIIITLAVAGMRSSNKIEGYSIADRDVGLFALIATLVMTEFNTSTLLAFSAIGYKTGIIAIGLPLVFLIGLLFYTLIVAKYWKKFNRLSVAELFTEKYDSNVGKFASALLILAMIGFSSTYVKSLILIFTPIFNVNSWILSMIIVISVILLTISGGLKSIIKTDIISFIITIIGLPSLLFIALYKYGGINSLRDFFPAEQLYFSPIEQWNNEALPFWFITSLIVLTSFTYISSPWYGQKIFAARTEKIAFIGVAITSILVFLLYVSAVLTASFFKIEHPNLIDAQIVFPAIIKSWLPPFWRGIGYAVLFTATMTTLTSAWNVMASMIKADFLPIRTNSVKAQRLLIIIFAIISLIGANLLGDNILNRLILANIPILALSFALIAGFYWSQANKTGAWVSILVGILWGVGCFIYFGDAGGYSWYWTIYGIPLIFASGILGSLFEKYVTLRKVTTN